LVPSVSSPELIKYSFLSELSTEIAIGEHPSLLHVINWWLSVLSLLIAISLKLAFINMLFSVVSFVLHSSILHSITYDPEVAVVSAFI